MSYSANSVASSAGAQRWSRSEKWSVAEPFGSYDDFFVLNAGRDLRNGRPTATVQRRTSRMVLNAGRDLRNGREIGEKTGIFVLYVLNAGRDLRNGRKGEQKTNRSLKTGAQRWSRSEKWSEAKGFSTCARCGQVLNAGRDLRNGRPSQKNFFQNGG